MGARGWHGESGGWRRRRLRRRSPGASWRGVVVAAGVMAVSAASVAGEVFTVSGLSGGAHSLNTFQGVIYTPFSGLSGSGPILRGWLKAGRFSYLTDLPGRADTRIDAQSYAIEGEAGWQVAGKWGRLGVLAGASFRDHMLQPDDPGSNLARARVVATLAVDGEYRPAPGWGVMANASHALEINQTWAQARPFRELGNGMKVGPEAALAAGDDYSFVHAGAFVSGYGLDVAWIGRVYLGGEVGARFDLKDGPVEAYAGFHVGRRF